MKLSYLPLSPATSSHPEVIFVSGFTRTDPFFPWLILIQTSSLIQVTLWLHMLLHRVSECWKAGPGSQQESVLLLTTATAYCHCSFWVLFGFFKGEVSIMGQNSQALPLCLWLQHVHSSLVLLSKKNL